MRTRIAPLKFPSVLVFGVLCAGAQAQGPKWELVNTREADDAGGNEYFVNTANLRFTETPITANVLIQHPHVQTLLESGYEYRSSIRLSVFDCVQRRFTLRAITAYSGDRGTGDVLRTVDTGIGEDLTWTDVTPRSVDEAILKFVCSRAPKQAQ